MRRDKVLHSASGPVRLSEGLTIHQARTAKTRRKTGSGGPRKSHRTRNSMHFGPAGQLGSQPSNRLVSSVHATSRGRRLEPDLGLVGDP